MRKNSWALLADRIEAFNVLTAYLSSLAMVACAGTLVFEIVVRHWLRWATDWEIEFCVILLIVSTFMSAAYTQSIRGHVNIEILREILPPRWNRRRLLLADILSLGFCAFVAWNAWGFFYEAWSDGRVSDSAWAPKLWIPYLFMALGLTTLTLQILIQVLGHRRKLPS